ncbi:Nuclear transcription factor Y subunit B-8 [Sesamum alatum]|uniref:Nuclear transcription factor Y subunit B-8 n=1 Tax=Sesamum alatum TaxID=300844 RepID=A0AAE1YTS4_9LAMI|nr:Nuclear transcription factor Y subunit B-8 [Sesamum alatum]
MADSPGGHGVAGGSGSHESGGGGGDQSPQSGVREQDRFLPIANIGRIMKKALPANGKIAKDAKDTVQECVSEFISFITSEASDKCQKEKRKTINGDDLLWAMATLGFEDYIAPLKAYLARATPKDLLGVLMDLQRKIQLELSWVLMHSLLIKVPFHKVSATRTPKLNIDLEKRI